MKNRYKKNIHWFTSNRNRTRKRKRSVFISYNFSDVEDNVDAFCIIRDIVAHAGKNAAAEAKAAGLSRVYIRNNKRLVKISPNGEEIAIAPKIEKGSYYIYYKPSTVLHAIKK
jgi:hypothetical protein